MSACLPASTPARPSRTLLSENQFDSRYGGVYAALVKGSFFSDAQITYDRTDFEINSNIRVGGVNTPLVTGQKPGSSRLTVSGSAGYAFSFDDISVVPSTGFAYSHTKTDTIALAQNGGSLAFQSLDTVIGFASVAVAKTIILPNETSAIQPFVTATIYNDFGDDQKVAFTDNNNTTPVLTSTQNIGTFGEISTGLNYRAILDSDTSRLREVSASVRGDLTFSNRLIGGRGTLQVRLQF